MLAVAPGHLHLLPLAGAGLILCLAAWILGRRPATTDRGARTARYNDLALLRRQGGILLGRYVNRALYAEPNVSCALIGPTQSGKTLSVVVPAIRSHAGPLIVLSVKDDVLRYTLPEREARGEVKIFDPTGQSKYPSQAWSPVAASDGWEHARAMAAGLLEIGQADRLDREPHWRRAAAKYLAPLLMAAHEAGATMRAVLSWIELIEKDELRAILRQSRNPDAKIALENLEGMWKTDQRYQGSVLGTLSTALDAWQTPSVAATTSTPDITPDWLCFGANTVYIVAPAQQQQRLQNLFGGLLVYLIDGAFEIAQRNTGRLDPPLLCALDEVCNAAPLPTLGRYASSGAGQGVVLLSVFQDVAQAIDTFGRERAATVLSNHLARLIWPGTGDIETTKYVEQLCGQKELVRSTRSRSPGGTSTSERIDQRPLVPAHELRQKDRGRTLLVYRNLPPVWVTQRIAPLSDPAPADETPPPRHSSRAPRRGGRRRPTRTRS